MRELDNLCAKCWQELTNGSVCDQCGYDNDQQNDMANLAAKTVLAEKYAVGAVTAVDSDSVTYSGFDGQLDKPVIVREFFPKGMCSRLEGNAEVHVRQKFIAEFDKYKKSFKNLWLTMEKLHSLSAAVPVYDVFEENGTVYAIIEEMDSVPLREYLLHNTEGYISWDTARLMFMPVLTTIESLHKNNIIHASITPDNLLLCRDGKVRLGPFPIQEASNSISSMEFVENQGYTALEQYSNNHKMCPATDIYAFAACIYRALVGTNPPSAMSREANDKLMIPNTIAEKIPIHVIKALVAGLQIYPEKRIKSVETFRELLDAAPSVKAKAAESNRQSKKAEEQSPEEVQKDYSNYLNASYRAEKRRKATVIILVVLIVAAIAGAVYVVKYSGLVNTNPQTESTTVAKQSYQVPNFVSAGYTQSDIENNGAWNQQFKFTFQGEYSSDTEEGIIFKQSIAAGETVTEGDEIILTVSKGIQTEVVPDVSGLALDEATKQLEELGFKVSTVEVYNNGSHTKDTVREYSGMAPAPDSVVAVGEEIILQVYGEVETTTEPAVDTTEAVTE